MKKRTLLSALNTLAEISARRVEAFGAQYHTFGVFGFLNYPFSFIILYYVENQRSESLVLRLIASGLCLLLVLRKHWPEKFVKYLPLYWQFTLMYCLPFLGALMMLRSGISKEWLMNMVQGLFLFVLLVDWSSFVVLMTVGSILGVVVFFLTGGEIGFNWMSNWSMPWSSFAYMYIYAIVMGIIFGRNREKINEAKLQALKSLAYSIAHEMRTPLATIAIGASNLKKYIKVYDEVYSEAKSAGLPVPTIEARGQYLIKDIPDTMEKVSNNAQNIINMLLMKVRDIPVGGFEPCLLSHCLAIALEQYPLKEEERKKISVEIGYDFSFLGKEEIFIHVLFNLLKNGLYQISLIKNGQISIWTEEGEIDNKLYFKDNGKGISKRIHADIFNRFVTGTEFGTGMGLAFCRMVMSNFGGSIECSSSEGRGAEFILSFPKVAIDKSEFKAQLQRSDPPGALSHNSYNFFS